MLHKKIPHFQRFVVLWKGTEERPGEIAVVEGIHQRDDQTIVNFTRKGPSGFEEYDSLPLKVFNKHKASIYEMAVLYLEGRREAWYSQIKNVHTRHCCKTHGCKYGDDDCCTVQTTPHPGVRCELCENKA